MSGRSPRSALFVALLVAALLLGGAVVVAGTATAQDSQYDLEANATYLWNDTAEDPVAEDNKTIFVDAMHTSYNRSALDGDDITYEWELTGGEGELETIGTYGNRYALYTPPSDRDGDHEAEFSLTASYDGETSSDSISVTVPANWSAPDDPQDPDDADDGNADDGTDGDSSGIGGGSNPSDDGDTTRGGDGGDTDGDDEGGDSDTEPDADEGADEDEPVPVAGGAAASGDSSDGGSGGPGDTVLIAVVLLGALVAVGTYQKYGA